MNTLPNGQSGRLSDHGGGFSWQSSHSHIRLGTGGVIPARASHDLSIDPQLRNDLVHNSGTTLPVSQQLFSLSSPHENLARNSQSTSHSRDGSQQLTSIFPRTLPSQNVTDETFDDIYASFILYCNPSIPDDTDTQELRKAFRSPPKSDGKNFSTFALFELIRKLEMKEIKTWAQLAIDLGVEPPAMDKGQSAQKVQQYAVRLKVGTTFH